MSTKTIGVFGRGLGWQKVGIELGSFIFYPNSSQPGMFQTFAPYPNNVDKSNVFLTPPLIIHRVNELQHCLLRSYGLPGLLIFIRHGKSQGLL